MKTRLIQRSLATLVLGFALSGTAVAERFNDRGPVFSPIPSTLSAPSVPVTAPAVVSRYNDRGVHFPNTVPLGSPAPRPPMIATVSGGFNDRNTYPTNNDGWRDLRGGERRFAKR